MYCVKCKKKTQTSKVNYAVSKNGKCIKKGKCENCLKMKSQFISNEEAKKGGFIFSVPAVLAGLGAVGSLASGAASVATAVNKKKTADKKIAETIRHNKAMEKKSSGKGLFLKPAKGSGLHLKPYKK